jgi:serine/tyrosine/threonine adenylyltransferase
VVWSPSALELLGLSQDQVTSRDDAAAILCGNKVLSGSDPVAHCYCGYQFGFFSGQLGDGAAISLGEVVNGRGERWELQLKGAGPTPYSRSADGRKVLRSTLREFLCSEAMHALGIPTTRAGSVVMSSSTIVRDVFYIGRPREEPCAVVTRIAPSFLRFGSFEIFKSTDPVTRRTGPSPGNLPLLHRMVDVTCNTLFADVVTKHDTASLPPVESAEAGIPGFKLSGTTAGAPIVAGEWCGEGRERGVLS